MATKAQIKALQALKAGAPYQSINHATRSRLERQGLVAYDYEAARWLPSAKGEAEIA